MDLSKIPHLCERYGRDAVFLVGGGLQAHDPDLARGTRAYLQEIARHYAAAP
jgi:ribulose 1,5-bisphosphate carboxylase large subunit-like protein